jgi:hypothetical protein
LLQDERRVKDFTLTFGIRLQRKSFYYRCRFIQRRSTYFDAANKVRSSLNQSLEQAIKTSVKVGTECTGLTITENIEVTKLGDYSLLQIQLTRKGMHGAPRRTLLLSTHPGFLYKMQSTVMKAKSVWFMHQLL